MVKAKEIRSIIKNIKKYKNLLNKEMDPVEKFKFENELKLQQYSLMDVEFQLLNIDVYLYRDKQLYKDIFIDKYINGLTGNKLIIKYNITRTTLYNKLSIVRKVFEYEYKI
ncbi:hypothetical protein FDB28_16095 [Clostridium botulinum]|nr:hypothetical protein [Clostridium botulinum]NFS97432.1 hypothetical protein [Clostridium botulinum]